MSAATDGATTIRVKPQDEDKKGVQWRCCRCGRLLAIGDIAPDTKLLIKCKCKHWNVLP